MGIAIETSRDENVDYSTREHLKQGLGKDYRKKCEIKHFIVKDLIPQQIQLHFSEETRPP
jgi:hypothetical protein